MRVSTIKQKLSYVPIQIEMYFKTCALSLGTAFVYANNDKEFFVTNWHNVTGRNPETGKPMSNTGAIPDSILLMLPSKETSNSGHTVMRWTGRKLALYT